VLEPTALPGIQRDSGVPTLQETDALLVWGGNILYLNYEMQKSTLAGLDNPDPIFEVKSMANIQRWAAGVPVPTHAIDDETASRCPVAASKSSPSDTGGCSPLRQQATDGWHHEDCLAVGGAGANDQKCHDQAIVLR
jgi:hypothetical protein